MKGVIKGPPGNPVRITYGSYTNPIRIRYESYGNNKGRLRKSYINPIQLLYESYTSQTFEDYTTIKKEVEEILEESNENNIRIREETYTKYIGITKGHLGNTIRILYE